MKNKESTLLFLEAKLPTSTLSLFTQLALFQQDIVYCVSLSFIHLLVLIFLLSYSIRYFVFVGLANNYIHELFDIYRSVRKAKGWDCITPPYCWWVKENVKVSACMAYKDLTF